MKLECELDNCPLSNNAVNMLECCGHSKRRKCQWYAAKVWSEHGVVTCSHAAAKHISGKLREERRLKLGHGLRHLQEEAKDAIKQAKKIHI